MNQALLQDVVAEVMRRLNDARPGVRAGEDAAANEPQRRQTYAHPHTTDVQTGKYGVLRRWMMRLAPLPNRRKAGGAFVG